MTRDLSIPKVFFVAGENSGDALGASVMRALQAKTRGRIRFVGVGGPEMSGVGMDSLFPMEDLAVMGVFEVLPRLPLLLKRIEETANAVEALKPDVLLTIDAPDFCFRVVKKLKARGVTVPVVHFVAPSVWAWRPGRAAKVAKFLDHLLCLLPFEPPYFEKEGLKATFVGHPVVSSTIGDGDGASFRARHNIAPDAPLLCVLPGSRGGEVERLLPIFAGSVAKLAPQFPGLHIVIPTVTHLGQRIAAAARDWPVPVTLVDGTAKADAFAASDAAMAASGTVALELAMAGLASVVAYRVHPLTAFLAKRLLKTRFVNLINIILGREAVAELIQENCTPDNLAREAARLMGDESARQLQREAAYQALKQLGFGGPPPGDRAAEVVLSYIQTEHGKDFMG